MADLTATLICAACSRSYGVELRRMRLNLEHPCPGCGCTNKITEDQAIKAHRLLEELEREMVLRKVA